MKASLYRFVNAFEDTGLWAVELLVTLTVFFRKLNHKFKVRAMEACVSRDFPTAAPKDLLQVRCVLGKKSNYSAIRRIHQRAINYCRGSASYTFHNINSQSLFKIIHIEPD